MVASVNPTMLREITPRRLKAARKEKRKASVRRPDYPGERWRCCAMRSERCYPEAVFSSGSAASQRSGSKVFTPNAASTIKAGMHGAE
jgi:hypothetical protein